MLDIHLSTTLMSMRHYYFLTGAGCDDQCCAISEDTSDMPSYNTRRSMTNKAFRESWGREKCDHIDGGSSNRNCGGNTQIILIKKITYDHIYILLLFIMSMYFDD